MIQNRFHPMFKNPSGRGFTLIEMVLVTFLSTMVMGIIALLLRQQFMLDRQLYLSIDYIQQLHVFSEAWRKDISLAEQIEIKEEQTDHPLLVLKLSESTLEYSVEKSKIIRHVFNQQHERVNTQDYHISRETWVKFEVDQKTGKTSCELKFNQSDLAGIKNKTAQQIPQHKIMLIQFPVNYKPDRKAL